MKDYKYLKKEETADSALYSACIKKTFGFIGQVYESFGGDPNLFTDSSTMYRGTLLDNLFNDERKPYQHPYHRVNPHERTITYAHIETVVAFLVVEQVV